MIFVYLHIPYSLCEILQDCTKLLTPFGGSYVQQELAAVFKKIGDKQTCTTGLYELYRITQLHPQVPFWPDLFTLSCSSLGFLPSGNKKCELGFVNLEDIIFEPTQDASEQVDIFSQLQNASEAFRTYISEGIAQV
jgi:cytoskeleton-associated protein 5